MNGKRAYFKHKHLPGAIIPDLAQEAEAMLDPSLMFMPRLVPQ